MSLENNCAHVTLAIFQTTRMSRITWTTWCVQLDIAHRNIIALKIFGLKNIFDIIERPVD